MNKKLPQHFYQQPANTIAKEFLGKYLVHKTRRGIISGMIVEVESYPAGIDQVAHGNKKTNRTRILHGPAGFAYVYLIYGMHYQLGVTVNSKHHADVMFIRVVVPDEGIELMIQNYYGSILTRDLQPAITANTFLLTKSPGRLCKAFGITMDHYGIPVTGKVLYMEDRGVIIPSHSVHQSPRIGLNPKLQGFHSPLRFYIHPVKR